jgi:hypothetical protein
VAVEYLMVLHNGYSGRICRKGVGGGESGGDGDRGSAGESRGERTDENPTSAEQSVRACVRNC